MDGRLGFNSNFVQTSSTCINLRRSIVTRGLTIDLVFALCNGLLTILHHRAQGQSGLQIDMETSNEPAPVSTDTELQPDLIRQTMLDLAARCDADKSFSPSDVAMALKGKNEKLWHTVMKPIRRIAIEMALRGEIVISRKGKSMDPNAFKGVYRLGVPKK